MCCLMKTKKKSKITVELEEGEENRKSQVCIDIWEVDEKTPETGGTIVRPVHAQTRESSTPKVLMIQKERQYPSPNLAFGEDMRSFNRSFENKSPQDYSPERSSIALRQLAIVTSA